MAKATRSIRGFSHVHAWQLGGVFVVTPDGKTVYDQMSREAGDHASMPELLEVLDRL